MFCTEFTLTTTGTSTPTPRTSTQNKDAGMRFITTKYIDVNDDGTSKVVADADVNGAGVRYDESILEALDDILGKRNQQITNN